MERVQSRQQQVLKERQTESKVSKNSASSHFYLHKNYNESEEFLSNLMNTKVVLEFYSIFRNTSDLLNHKLWTTLPIRLCGRIIFCTVLLAAGVSRVWRRVAQVATLSRKQNPVGSTARPQSGSEPGTGSAHVHALLLELNVGITEIFPCRLPGPHTCKTKLQLQTRTWSLHSQSWENRPCSGTTPPSPPGSCCSVSYRTGAMTAASSPTRSRSQT